MDPSEVFEALRPRLLGVAYRILGSVTDAEDVLQDAWVRWSRTDVDSVLNPEAYLVTVVGRPTPPSMRRLPPSAPWLLLIVLFAIESGPWL